MPCLWGWKWVDREMSDHICKCPCHESEATLLHCGPCCITCPECGLRIQWLHQEEHILGHPGLNERLIAEGRGGYMKRIATNVDNPTEPT